MLMAFSVAGGQVVVSYCDPGPKLSSLLDPYAGKLVRGKLERAYRQGKKQLIGSELPERYE